MGRDASFQSILKEPVTVAAAWPTPAGRRVRRNLQTSEFSPETKVAGANWISQLFKCGTQHNENFSRYGATWANFPVKRDNGTKNWWSIILLRTYIYTQPMSPFYGAKGLCHIQAWEHSEWVRNNDYTLETAPRHLRNSGRAQQKGIISSISKNTTVPT